MRDKLMVTLSVEEKILALKEQSFRALNRENGGGRTSKKQVLS